MRIILLQIYPHQTFREDMSHFELFEATRGVWKTAKWRLEELEYALVVAKQEVREVYHIERWDKAGTHKYKKRKIDPAKFEGRWEFSGFLAEEEVRRQYIGQKTGQLGRKEFRYMPDFKALDKFIQDNNKGG